VPVNYIYVMRYGENLHKIGFSIKPLARLRALRSPSMDIGLVASWERPNGDAQVIEKLVHRALKPHRITAHGTTETFTVSAQRAIRAIEHVIAAVDGAAECAADTSLDFPQLVSPATVAFLPDGSPKRAHDEMEKIVVHPGHVFSSERRAKKLIRAGDTLLVRERDLPAMADCCERKGVYVRVV